MPELTQLPQFRAALETARTIALLGANPLEDRPAYYVPAYLHTQGYRILPVNPVHVGKVLFGQPVRATLAELDEPVDIVDIFRRTEVLFTHLDDILAMKPRARTVWLQQGIHNQEFTDRLVSEGFDVVQSRCTLADHRAFSIPTIARRP